MKKTYEEPIVDKIEFDYKDQVVASNESECFVVQDFTLRQIGCTSKPFGDPVVNNM